MLYIINKVEVSAIRSAQQFMQNTFAQAVTKIIELLSDTQRLIGEALLETAEHASLPVIRFDDEIR
jgi:hypothetical protein